METEEKVDRSCRGGGKGYEISKLEVKSDEQERVEKSYMVGGPSGLFDILYTYRQTYSVEFTVFHNKLLGGIPLMNILGKYNFYPCNN